MHGVLISVSFTIYYQNDARNLIRKCFLSQRDYLNDIYENKWQALHLPKWALVGVTFYILRMATSFIKLRSFINEVGNISERKKNLILKLLSVVVSIIIAKRKCKEREGKLNVTVYCHWYCYWFCSVITFLLVIWFNQIIMALMKFIFRLSHQNREIHTLFGY